MAYIHFDQEMYLLQLFGKQKTKIIGKIARKNITNRYRRLAEKLAFPQQLFIQQLKFFQLAILHTRENKQFSC